MDAAISVYEQYFEQVRHHQDERRAIANTLTVIIGALVAVAAIDQRLDEQDFPIALTFIVIGLFGAACMVKCHGLIRFYKNMASTMARHIGSGAVSTFDVVALEEAVKICEPAFWRWIDKVRLWQLWLLLFVLVILVGLALLFILPSNGWILVSGYK
jgi:uncharacterized membrane protein